MANIRNNTTTIQSILETVRSLPEAGSGGVTPTETEELNPIIPSGKVQTFPPEGEKKLYSKVVINAVDDSVIKSIYGNNVVNTAVTDGTNAAAEHILSGKKAYVNGGEVAGTIVTNDYDDLKIDETDKSKVIVPKGYYAQNYSKSVNTGTLGKPSINKTTGKVSSKVNTAGYLTTDASTPDNNVLELTTMAGNKDNPITPSTTSKKVVSADTYTTGDIYVGAIPNTYVKPTYKPSDSGTITLSFGESKIYNASTYLANKVTIAAPASSGSGYIGNYISSQTTKVRSMTFSVDTTNLIGFTAIAAYYIEEHTGGLEYVTSITSCNGNIYYTTCGKSNDYVYNGFDVNELVSCSFDSGTITITLTTIRFWMNIPYYLFPIYSA